MNRLKAAACFIALILFASLILFAGCKSKSPPPAIVEAEGTVLLDGEPLKKVRVRFIPLGQYEQEYTAFGVTDDAGKFTLTCHGQPGAAVGENVVLVEESEVPEHLKGNGRIGENERIELNNYYKSLGTRPPLKYGNMANSPLTVTVSPNRKNHNISLSNNRDLNKVQNP